MPVYERLEPLKIYALRQNSLIDCEIKVYEWLFTRMQSELDDVLKQAFIQMATGDGLLMHEKLAGLNERPGLNDETRRSLVIYRRSVAPFDFNLQGMISSVRAAGLIAEIEENLAGESLKITLKEIIDDFFDLDSLKLSLFSMLPAHLEAEFDVGFMTWDMFDGYDMLWDDWDSIDFTWEEFDINADILFEGGL